MYLIILKILDVHNAQNFEKISYTKPLKNCQYRALLRSKIAHLQPPATT